MRLRSPSTLRALMAQERLSLGMLSAAVGVHRSFISHLVSGRSTGCSDAVAQRIADVLDVPVEVLFVPRGERVTRRRAVQQAINGGGDPRDGAPPVA